jgi:dihydrofolate reductase
MKIIVAHQVDLGIGIDNKLPWKSVFEDFQLFRLVTLGHTIAMGRKTWDSLPKKPLKGRRNIVISNSVDNLNGAEVVKSIDCFPDDCIVIGGSTLYKKTLELNKVDTVIATVFNNFKFNCNVFFPELIGFNKTKAFTVNKNCENEFDVFIHTKFFSQNQ